VDAHHHVWDLSVRDQPWTRDLPAIRRSFAFAELEPHLREHGFSGSIVVQTICEPQETPELLALAATEPLIAGVVGWADLTASDLREQVVRLREAPGGEHLVGLRHQIQDEPTAWLARTDVRRGLGVLADLGLVYDLVVRPDQLSAVVDLVAAVPELSFVLDHAGKPAIARGGRAPWATEIRRLAGLPNLTVKLSGLATEAGPNWGLEMLAPYVDTLVAELGPERLMFGSDWPVCLLAGPYDEILATAEKLLDGLSEAEHATVLGGTAARVYQVAR
jgi:L-fuconolactonase